MPVFEFSPSLASGTLARRGVQQRLAGSLAHVFERASGSVEFDRERGARLVRDLAAETPYGPRLFARYFDLVAAIQRNDRDDLSSALEALVAEPPETRSGPRLVAFGVAEMTASDQALIVSQFSSDGLRPFGPLTADEAGASFERFGAALSLLREAAPATYSEMSAVISEVVLVKSVRTQGRHPFRAASSLQYWGAIVIDTLEERSLVGLCEALAHEAAHNALFGFSPQNFFVWNRNDELYGSPLREDARPLDGIFHAAFVLARMHFAVSELLHSGRLSPSQADEAGELLGRDVRAFEEGREVLEAHARFTDEGRAILSAANDYMAKAAAQRR